MSSEVSEDGSSRDQACLLEMMPVMEFDKYLLTPYKEDTYSIGERRIEIPIFFGVTMILLREKHEVELSNGRSFIETEPPASTLVETLVNRVLINCTSVDDLFMVLSRVKAVVLFYTLTELLSRMPEPLIPLSAKTAQLFSKSLLLPPLKPYGYAISQELFERVTRHYAEKGDSDLNRFKRSKVKHDVVVHPLVEKYYMCEQAPQRRVVRLHNKVNKGIFHDLHSIESTMQRNLARFIIRNVIHLARRYIVVNFRRLCEQRREQWAVAHVTVRPHIIDHVFTRFADILGNLVFRQSGVPEYYPDVEKRAMLNVLSSSMERMWFPGQGINDVVLSLEPTYCHANCVCGRGVSTVLGGTV